VLVRNAGKIAVPWTLGHAAALELAHTANDPDWSTWLLTVAAYVLPIWYLVSLFVGTGRTPYDRVAGALVGPRRSTPSV
jgi:hypothetical protein